MALERAKRLRAKVARRPWGENVLMALDTLRNNKLRSALTLVSITVAVTTLIAVVAMLMGLDRNVQESIQSYGINTAFFSHFPTGPRFGNLTKEERMRKPLSYDDFLAVKESCLACENVTVSIFPNDIAAARYKDREVVGLDFRGATGEFFSVYANAVVKEGRPFTESENQHRLETVVLGEDLANGLFPDSDPIGKTVIVDGHPFQVIGVFEKPKGGLGPGNADNRAVVPYWTFRKVYPMMDVHGIRIEAYAGRLPEAIDQTRVSLRRTRRLTYSQPDNFDYSTADSIIESFHQIVGMVGLAVMVISSVGLMIGGVGVMNIMLVSVTERTREIGVRKAMGARKRDIMLQFTLEAVTLTALGGVLGVALGAMLTSLVRVIWSSLPARMSVFWTMTGFWIACATGLVFGIYPAWKASKLDPIEALRYE